jgi:EAL domain-containing protein (putative c-di-GMP-specific phosphodiesterase class I)/FixJ family two-component response regulator
MTAKELNLLVVEDDAFQRRLIVDMLCALGATSVTEAGDGKQALEILRGANSRPVDVALCDLNMPGMDGLEFLRHVGQDDRHRLSIIILSAMDGKVLTSVGRMSAMYGIRLLGVVEKPIGLEQLRDLLSAYHPLKSDGPVSKAAAAFTLEEIRQGIRSKQFEPFFQPKVDCRTGRLVGAEALARWRHPEHGLIPPLAFISLLEESGDIDELTFLMLEQAVSACRSVRNARQSLTVSVNLSLVSLDDTALADRITQVVLDAGLDPSCVILEITESAAMTNAGHALENLARLRMRGFGLSIDDYGTGYSTMQQLTRIAFSELKIDRSFVKEVAANEALRIVVESSIDLARKLRVVSVAEGVETQQDWDAVKSMGCDTAQGYFIARPMDLDSFVEYCAGNAA